MSASGLLMRTVQFFKESKEGVCEEKTLVDLASGLDEVAETGDFASIKKWARTKNLVSTLIHDLQGQISVKQSDDVKDKVKIQMVFLAIILNYATFLDSNLEEVMKSNIISEYLKLLAKKHIIDSFELQQIFIRFRADMLCTIRNVCGARKTLVAEMIKEQPTLVETLIFCILHCPEEEREIANEILSNLTGKVDQVIVELLNTNFVDKIKARLAKDLQLLENDALNTASLIKLCNAIGSCFAPICGLLEACVLDEESLQKKFPDLVQSEVFTAEKKRNTLTSLLDSPPVPHVVACVLTIKPSLRSKGLNFEAIRYTALSLCILALQQRREFEQSHSSGFDWMYPFLSGFPSPAFTNRGFLEEASTVLTQLLFLIYTRPQDIPNTLRPSITDISLHLADVMPESTELSTLLKSSFHKASQWQDKETVPKKVKKNSKLAFLACSNPFCEKSTVSEARLFHRCTRCQSVQYCGEPCQRIDWPRHSKECRSLAAARASGTPSPIAPPTPKNSTDPQH